MTRYRFMAVLLMIVKGMVCDASNEIDWSVSCTNDGAFGLCSYVADLDIGVCCSYKRHLYAKGFGDQRGSLITGVHAKHRLGESALCGITNGLSLNQLDKEGSFIGYSSALWLESEIIKGVSVVSTVGLYVPYLYTRNVSYNWQDQINVSCRLCANAWERLLFVGQMSFINCLGNAGMGYASLSYIISQKYSVALEVDYVDGEARWGVSLSYGRVHKSGVFESINTLHTVNAFSSMLRQESMVDAQAASAEVVPVVANNYQMPNYTKEKRIVIRKDANGDGLKECLYELESVGESPNDSFVFIGETKGAKVTIAEPIILPAYGKRISFVDLTIDCATCIDDVFVITPVDLGADAWSRPCEIVFQNVAFLARHEQRLLYNKADYVHLMFENTKCLDIDEQNAVDGSVTSFRDCIVSFDSDNKRVLYVSEGDKRLEDIQLGMCDAIVLSGDLVDSSLSISTDNINISIADRYTWNNIVVEATNIGSVTLGSEPLFNIDAKDVSVSCAGVSIYGNNRLGTVSSNANNFFMDFRQADLSNAGHIILDINAEGEVLLSQTMSIGACTENLVDVIATHSHVLLLGDVGLSKPIEVRKNLFIYGEKGLCVFNNDGLVEVKSSELNKARSLQLDAFTDESIFSVLPGASLCIDGVALRLSSSFDGCLIDQSSEASVTLTSIDVNRAYTVMLSDDIEMFSIERFEIHGDAGLRSAISRGESLSGGYLLSHNLDLVSPLVLTNDILLIGKQTEVSLSDIAGLECVVRRRNSTEDIHINAASLDVGIVLKKGLLEVHGVHIGSGSATWADLHILGNGCVVDMRDVPNGICNIHVNNNATIKIDDRKAVLALHGAVQPDAITQEYSDMLIIEDVILSSPIKVNEKLRVASCIETDKCKIWTDGSSVMHMKEPTDPCFVVSEKGRLYIENISWDVDILAELHGGLSLGSLGLQNIDKSLDVGISVKDGGNLIIEDELCAFIDDLIEMEATFLYAAPNKKRLVLVMLEDLELYVPIRPQHDMMILGSEKSCSFVLAGHTVNARLNNSKRARLTPAGSFLDSLFYIDNGVSLRLCDIDLYTEKNILEAHGNDWELDISDAILESNVNIQMFGDYGFITYRDEESEVHRLKMVGSDIDGGTRDFSSIGIFKGAVVSASTSIPVHDGVNLFSFHPLDLSQGHTLNIIHPVIGDQKPILNLEADVPLFVSQSGCSGHICVDDINIRALNISGPLIVADDAISRIMVTNSEIELNRHIDAVFEDRSLNCVFDVQDISIRFPGDDVSCLVMLSQGSEGERKEYTISGIENDGVSLCLMGVDYSGDATLEVILNTDASCSGRIFLRNIPSSLTITSNIQHDYTLINSAIFPQSKSVLLNIGDSKIGVEYLCKGFSAKKRGLISYDMLFYVLQEDIDLEEPIMVDSTCCILSHGYSRDITTIKSGVYVDTDKVSHTITCGSNTVAISDGGCLSLGEGVLLDSHSDYDVIINGENARLILPKQGYESDLYVQFLCGDSIIIDQEVVRLTTGMISSESASKCSYLLVNGVTKVRDVIEIHDKRLSIGTGFILNGDRGNVVICGANIYSRLDLDKNQDVLCKMFGESELSLWASLHLSSDALVEVQHGAKAKIDLSEWIGEHVHIYVHSDAILIDPYGQSIYLLYDGTFFNFDTFFQQQLINQAHVFLCKDTAISSDLLAYNMTLRAFDEDCAKVIDTEWFSVHVYGHDADAQLCMDRCGIGLANGAYVKIVGDTISPSSPGELVAITSWGTSLLPQIDLRESPPGLSLFSFEMEEGMCCEALLSDESSFVFINKITFPALTEICNRVERLSLVLTEDIVLETPLDIRNDVKLYGGSKLDAWLLEDDIPDRVDDSLSPRTTSITAPANGFFFNKQRFVIDR